MHLQDHPRIQPAVGQPGVHGDHGALDDVCRRALHRGVDRGAFGAAAQGRVLGIDVRHIQPTAEQGFDEALLGGLGAGALHVLEHAGVLGEIAIDVGLRLLAIDADLLGQAECAHAVDQAEVDRLGAASLVDGDLSQVHTEHFRCRGAVHVQIVLEGMQQAFVLGQVGHDAQFDLGIVGSQQTIPRRGDERLTDAAAFGGADRNVLQVRITG